MTVARHASYRAMFRKSSRSLLGMDTLKPKRGDNDGCLVILTLYPQPFDSQEAYDAKSQCAQYAATDDRGVRIIDRVVQWLGKVGIIWAALFVLPGTKCEKPARPVQASHVKRSDRCDVQRSQSIPCRVPPVQYC